MNFDFSTPITTYELIAILISIVALIMPIIVWIIKNIFLKTRIKLYPTNQLKLLYNESGSYINIDFSLECKNKSAVIKNIETEIIRECDNKKLELIQSTFKSPAYAMIGNNFVSNNECAHPIKIDVDELRCIFLEEAQKDGEIINRLKNIHDNKMNNFENFDNYVETVKKFKEKESYNQMYAKLYEELFWKKSKYKMKIVIMYNQKEKFVKEFVFEIDEKESKLFEENVEKALICRIGNIYGINTTFYCGNKSYIEKNS